VSDRIPEKRHEGAGVAARLEHAQRVRRVHPHAPRGIAEERHEPRTGGRVPDVADRPRGHGAHEIDLVGGQRAKRLGARPIADPADRVGHAPPHLGRYVACRCRERRDQGRVLEPRGGERCGATLCETLGLDGARERRSRSLPSGQPERGDQRVARMRVGLHTEPADERRGGGRVADEAEREGGVPADSRRAIVERAGERGDAAAVLDPAERDGRRGARRGVSVGEKPASELGRVAARFAIGDGSDARDLGGRGGGVSVRWERRQERRNESQSD
jgi:hypothetical protein